MKSRVSPLSPNGSLLKGPDPYRDLCGVLGPYLYFWVLIFSVFGFIHAKNGSLFGPYLKAWGSILVLESADSQLKSELADYIPFLKWNVGNICKILYVLNLNSHAFSDCEISDHIQSLLWSYTFHNQSVNFLTIFPFSYEVTTLETILWTRDLNIHACF